MVGSCLSLRDGNSVCFLGRLPSQKFLYGLSFVMFHWCYFLRYWLYKKHLLTLLGSVLRFRQTKISLIVETKSWLRAYQKRNLGYAAD